MEKFRIINFNPEHYDIISKEDAEKQGCKIDEIISKLVQEHPKYNKGIILNDVKLWCPIKFIDGLPYFPVPEDTCTISYKILSRNDDEVVVKILFNKCNNG